MSISGHRSRAVFDRYNITSTDDLHEAAQRQNQDVEDAIVTRQSKGPGFPEFRDAEKRSLTH